MSPLEFRAYAALRQAQTNYFFGASSMIEKIGVQPVEFPTTKIFYLDLTYGNPKPINDLACIQHFSDATRPDGNVEHRSYWLDQYYKQMNSLNSDERKSVLKQILDGIIGKESRTEPADSEEDERPYPRPCCQSE